MRFKVGKDRMRKDLQVGDIVYCDGYVNGRRSVPVGKVTKVDASINNSVVISILWSTMAAGKWECKYWNTVQDSIKVTSEEELVMMALAGELA